MTSTRPDAENDEISRSWIPSTAEGLSMMSTCSYPLWILHEPSELILIDPRNEAEELGCESLELAIVPGDSAEGSGRNARALKCPSIYSTFLHRLDKDATMVACCLESTEEPCTFTPEGENALFTRYPQRNDLRSSSVNSGGLKAQARVRRQDGSASSNPITTTITLQTTGPSSAASTTTADPALPSSSTPLSSALTPAPTTSSPSATSTEEGFSTVTSIPLLIATGTLFTTYSIASIASTPSSSATPASNGSSGLSVGAKAGITIAVVFAVLAIGCILALIHMKRRRRVRTTGERAPSRSERRRQKKEAGRIEVGFMQDRSKSRSDASPTNRQPSPNHPVMQGARSPGPRLTNTYMSTGDAPAETKKDEALLAAAPSIEFGPHELGSPTNETKETYELDAGYTGEVASTIDTIPSAVSRGASPDMSISRLAPDSTAKEATRRPSVPESLRAAARDRNGSLGERVRTPDTYTSRGMTPVSIFNNSRSATPDISSRDPRERMMGHVSPMSAATERTERSFLDLD